MQYVLPWQKFKRKLQFPPDDRRSLRKYEPIRSFVTSGPKFEAACQFRSIDTGFKGALSI